MDRQTYRRTDGHEGTKIHLKEQGLFRADFTKKSLSPYDDKYWITNNEEDVMDTKRLMGMK